MKTIMTLALVMLSFAAPATTFGQDAVPEEETSGKQPSHVSGYVPIGTRQRVGWIVDGIVGPRSLGFGAIAAGWQTAWNSPAEWGRGWSGFQRRYLARGADVALSTTLEAGVGALWGEEPRYIASHRRGIWARARYSMKTVVVAHRPDGRLRPAWGRYVGNTMNNVIENAWLPPSATTPRATIVRSASGLFNRLAGNLYEEFGPDVQRMLQRHP